MLNIIIIVVFIILAVSYDDECKKRQEEDRKLVRETRERTIRAMKQKEAEL